MLAGPTPPLGFIAVKIVRAPGPTAVEPKLPAPSPGCHVNGVPVPSPVEVALRTRELPPIVSRRKTLWVPAKRPGPTAISGWSAPAPAMVCTGR